MAKKEKLPLITTIPSDPAERKRLYKSISESVSLKQQIKDLQVELANIKTVEKESYGYDGKAFNNWVKLEWSKQKEASKTQAEAELLLEQDAELDILAGRSSNI